MQHIIVQMLYAMARAEGFSAWCDGEELEELQNNEQALIDLDNWVQNNVTDAEEEIMDAFVSGEYDGLDDDNYDDDARDVEFDTIFNTIADRLIILRNSTK